MLSDALYQIVATDSAVLAILGTRMVPPGRPKTTGVFLAQMPEGEPTPAIVHSQVAGDGIMTMDGPSSMRFARWQFNCRAPKAAQAKQLQRAVRQALEAFTGTTSDGTQIGNIEEVLVLDVFEDAPFSFVATLDVQVAFLDLGS
jgi:hypothetical protein